MKKLLIGIVCLTVLLIAVGCGSKKESSEETSSKKKLIEVTIADLRSEFWLPVYIAEQNGFFKDEGLKAEFTVFKDGPVAFQSTHAGEVDFCMLSTEPVVIGYDKGLESSIILSTLYKKPFMLIGSSSIKDVSDLKGKKIAAGTPGSAPYAFVSSILRSKGIDPIKDVELLNMDYAATLLALQKDEVQATFMDATRKSEKKIKGTNILVDTAEDKQHKDIYGSEKYESTIITTSKKFSKENPETVQKFTNAVLKAMDWQKKHSDKEIADLVKPMFEGKLDGTDLEKVITATRPFLSDQGEISKEGYAAIEKFCFSEKIIENKVPYDEIIDMSYVKKAKKEKSN